MLLTVGIQFGDFGKLGRFRYIKGILFLKNSSVQQSKVQKRTSFFSPKIVSIPF